MQRALAALFLTPAILGLLWSVSFAFFTVPILLAVTLVYALPVFLILNRHHALHWWAAVLIGIGGSVLVSITYYYFFPPYHVLVSGPRNIVFLLFTGILISSLAWCAGIFRNPAFEYISEKFPRSMWTVVVLLISLLILWVKLQGSTTTGRVTQLLTPSSLEIHSVSGEVELKLNDNSIVTAALPSGKDYSIPVGQCFSVEKRTSIFLTKNVFFVLSPTFRQNECTF